MDTATFNDVIDRDIELLWTVQEYVHRNPKYKEWLHKIISKNPLQDICALVWIAFSIGCYEMGWPHFWVVMTNLGAAWIGRKLLEIKRPVEYDVRLQPMTDLHPDSFGFPSIESYMAIVVFGHYIIHYKSYLLFLLLTPVVVLIGFTRIYAKSRFGHQIIGSWLTGLIGLLLAHRYAEAINIHKIEKGLHGTWGGVLVCIVLVNFALNMENNDSRLMGVNKNEFKSVLENILKGSSNNEDEVDDDMKYTDDDGNNYFDNGDDSSNDLITRKDTPRNSTKGTPPRGSGSGSGGGNIVETPRALAARRASMERATKRVVGVTKRDSFYYLQRTLERRQVQQTGISDTSYLNDLSGGGINGTPISMNGYDSRGYRSGRSTPRSPQGQKQA